MARRGCREFHISEDDIILQWGSQLPISHYRGRIVDTTIEICHLHTYFIFSCKLLSLLIDMPVCAVPGCNKSGVHLFPKDATLRKKWEKAIRRKNFIATDTSRLCRDHFHESDYVGMSSYTGSLQRCRHLKKGTIPSIFPWTAITSTPTSRALRHQRRSRRLDFTVHDEPSTSSAPDPALGMSEEIDMAMPEIEVTTVDSLIGNQQHSTISISTQTASSIGLLSLEAMRMNKDAIHFYTGLESYDKFMLVLDTLSPMCNNLTYRGSIVLNVSVCDQLLITMIKLRRYLPDFELAFLFGISETTVSNIFITWINFIYEIWSIIDIWPSKELVQFYMPEEFRQDFKTTKVIVDTTEFPISKPGNPVTQQATFSSYKHKNTLKAMVGATPGGLVSFVSECYGGSVSDRQIIERSGLDNLCQSGDSIMADKGFNVQDIFATKDITVNIPMFLKGRTQIPSMQVIHDRKLASKRVHIEIIIGLAKTFKILKSDLSPYYIPLGSQILYVCAMLCNFRENIMK